MTQALWQLMMGENPFRFKGADRPVEHVSWHNAKGFITRLNARVPGLDLCLPSEARWEYACRARTPTPYSFGEKISQGQANFGSRETVPVGSLPANGWSLFEMHGNIWEWCEDH